MRGKNRWEKIVGGVLAVLVVPGTASHFQNEFQTVRYHLCYSMMTSERDKKFSSYAQILYVLEFILDFTM